MKKLFLITVMFLTLFTTSAFAADGDSANSTAQPSTKENADLKTSDFVEYTSLAYGYKINVPWNPIVLDLHFEEPSRRGEMLVFKNQDADIILGYRIVLDAFDNKRVPDFNKADKKTLDNYLDVLKKVNLYELAELTTVSNGNKGVFAITAKEFQAPDENGQMQTVIASTQNAVAFFRTPKGRCIQIQLITNDLKEEDLKPFLYSVSTFDDPNPPMKNKKNSKK